MEKTNRGQSERSVSWTFIYNTLLEKPEFYDRALERFVKKNSISEKKNPFLNVAPDNINSFTIAWDKCVHLKDDEEYFFTAELKDTEENLHFFDIYATCLRPKSGENLFRILFTGRESQKNSVQANCQENDSKNIQQTIDLYNNKMEEFLHLAVHDLNAPVRKLSSLLDRFISKTKNDLSEENIGYIKRMESVFKQLSTLIESLSILHEVSVINNVVDTCDLKDLLHKTLIDMKAILQSADVSVNLMDLPVVKGNAYQLKLLFQNLIYNAIQFRNENKPLQIELISETLLPEEQIAYNLPSDKMYHKLIIKDNGMGYNEKNSDVIFQPFHKLHGQKFAGSGLGLTICKKIVNNHSGILYSKAAEGSGAQFIIILPKT